MRLLIDRCKLDVARRRAYLRSGVLSWRGCGAGEHAQYFFFAHDDEVFAIDLDFGAGILAEQDAVAFFYVERDEPCLLR